MRELAAAVAARDAELVRLRGLIESARSDEAENRRAGQGYVSQAAAVGESFERVVAGLSARIDARPPRRCGAQLDEGRRARWVAEQELAAERERGASGDRAAVAPTRWRAPSWSRCAGNWRPPRSRSPPTAPDRRTSATRRPAWSRT
ncbi:MAG: hypothetical protein R2736_17870 [Solirubrobacterales bacterium]